eukprot:COSAG01_NODE_68764_length_263_cov_0.634146_1_plen_47_part_01
MTGLLHRLLLLLLLWILMHAPMRTTVRAGQPSDWVPPKSNPLKGLPA